MRQHINDPTDFDEVHNKQLKDINLLPEVLGKELNDVNLIHKHCSTDDLSLRFILKKEVKEPPFNVLGCELTRDK